MQHLKQKRLELNQERVEVVKEYAKKKHRQANIIVGFVISALLISMIITRQRLFYDRPQVLGESTSETKSSPALNRCLSARGKNIYRYNSENVLQEVCQFEDGVLCKNSDISESGICINPIIPPPNTPTPTPDQYLYYVSIRDTNTENPDQPLTNYILETLSLFQDTSNITINSISYDALNGSPHEPGRKLNFAYYLSTNRPPVSLENQTEFKSMSFSPISSNFSPALEDRKFCQRDTDCHLRISLCEYGAFNIFEPYLDGYICRNNMDEFGNYRRAFDEAAGCQAELIFLNTQCINNRCEAKNPVLQCIDS